ncbi:hypothetical protein [Kamptonema sp. UHCC 0994]|uniref:hypothetical protein n=1 Tax=Kamptonema sp. UHCC 0994 TaxID=3031329 RepID=UPI0023B91A1D|nr:hypothetical protein [Kamptonema sp. UHCC 0994]
MAVKTYVTPPSGRFNYRLEGGVTDIFNGLGDCYNWAVKTATTLTKPACAGFKTVALLFL